MMKPPINSKNNLYYDDISNQQRYIIPIIRAQWPAPEPIYAFSTLAYYFSQSLVNHSANTPFFKKSFNLGLHTCTNEKMLEEVRFNRHILNQALQQKLLYFKQTHSDICHDLDLFLPNHLESTAAYNCDEIEGDASLSSQHPCLVMTADCLPIFMTDKTGQYYTAIHAGWRGIANGIVMRSVDLFLKKSGKKPEDLIIHFAPAIGEHAFEIEQDVIDIFYNAYPEIYRLHLNDLFMPISNDLQSEKKENQKFLANIYELARLQLIAAGVQPSQITQNQACTFFDQRFFSYRRSEMLKKKSPAQNLTENVDDNIQKLNILEHQNGRMAHIIYKKI